MKLVNLLGLDQPGHTLPGCHRAWQARLARGRAAASSGPGIESLPRNTRLAFGSHNW